MLTRPYARGLRRAVRAEQFANNRATVDQNIFGNPEIRSAAKKKKEKDWTKMSDEP